MYSFYAVQNIKHTFQTFYREKYRTQFLQNTKYTFELLKKREVHVPVTLKKKNTRPNYFKMDSTHAIYSKK